MREETQPQFSTATLSGDLGFLSTNDQRFFLTIAEITETLFASKGKIKFKNLVDEFCLVGKVIAISIAWNCFFTCTVT